MCREKENRSPTTRDTAEARRGSKQSRVRFAPGKRLWLWKQGPDLPVCTVCSSTLS